MRRLVYFLTSLCLATALLTSCHGKKEGNKDVSSTPGVDYLNVAIPGFDADSAYRFVAEQLAFGFRHPGTKGHAQCAEYLARTLKRFCDTVIVQPFTTTLWDGQKVEGRNIIGSLRPQADNRVLLAAHWDSRQWADHDLDTNNWHKPLPGANDGASGVAVIIEMARAMASMPPNVGIDFVLFDVEDQGITEWASRYEDNTWCKGSQHWAQNPHRMFYTAQYGILFDMVGTFEPRFTKEEISMGFAQGVMNKMWSCAAALGYGNIFVDEKTNAILDDHLYVNQLLHVPTIDVVQNSPNRSFYEHWHTVKDDIDAVDKNTLKTVATVTLKMIYADFPPENRNLSQKAQKNGDR